MQNTLPPLKSATGADVPEATVEVASMAAFHMAEYSTMKAEIGELVKAASSNLQYALAVSGGLAAWLLSAKAPKAGEQMMFSVNPEHLRLAFLLPILLSSAFGFLALAAYNRIKTKLDYLRKVEDRFRMDGLGWQHEAAARPKALGGLYGAVWFALTLVNAAFVVVGFH